MVQDEHTTEFNLSIEKLVNERDMTYMDALIHYCEQNSVEFQSAARMINAKIKDSIHLEASNLNMMKEKVQTLMGL